MPGYVNAIDNPDIPDYWTLTGIALIVGARRIWTPHADSKVRFIVADTTL